MSLSIQTLGFAAELLMIPKCKIPVNVELVLCMGLFVYFLD